MTEIKFIPEKWSWANVSLEKLIAERNVPIEWLSFFNRPEVQAEIKKISDTIKTETEQGLIIYPPPNLVFQAFTVPLEKIRLVLLGQDCYHDGAAVGLCFSVGKTSKINPSLLNIYRELENEGYSPDKNGDISHWAKQGVFMYNTALTVRKSAPESHLELWKNFSNLVLTEISENVKNVGWILLGSKACAFRPNNQTAFITSHPSPFSAHKGFRQYPAFLGSDLFKKIDAFLVEHNQPPMKW